MLISNTQEIPGKTIVEFYGVVSGSTVRAKHIGRDFMAGLKNLERFTFRGSPVRGHAFAKFAGWTRLKYINFHSNGLDDKGLGHVCESFPNLEFIKLWHSKLLTDASADHLKKLGRLKGIEISCSNASTTAHAFGHPRIGHVFEFAASCVEIQAVAQQC